MKAKEPLTEVEVEGECRCQNDAEKLKELEDLRKMGLSLKHHPQDFDKFREGLTWLAWGYAPVLGWMTASLSPREVSLAGDILDAIEGDIRQRNHSSIKVSGPAIP